MALRVMDPNYLPRDYVLNLLDTEFHHRFVFSHISAWLAGSPEALERTYLVLYLTFLFFTMLGVVRLARLMFESWGQRAVALVGFILLQNLVIHQFALSSNMMMEREFSPNQVTICLLIWTLYWVVAGAWRLAFLLPPLIAPFQAVEGVLAVGIAALAAWCLRAAPPLRLLIGAAASGTAVAGVVLWQMWLGGFSQAGGEAFRAMVAIRLSHHMLPQAWPLSQWVFGLAILTAGSACLLRTALPHGMGPALVRFGVIVAALFALIAAGIVATDSTWLMKLQPGKLPWAPYVLWALAIAGVVPALAVSWLASIAGIGRPVAAIAMAAVLAAAAGGLLLLRYGGDSAGLSAAIERQFTALRAGNYRTWDIYAHPDDLALYRWLRGNTPADAVVLHPLSLEYMRVGAERASVVDRFTSPFSDGLAREWIARLAAVEGYCEMSPEQIGGVAARYGARWIVVRQGCSPPAGAALAVTAGRWQVYRAGP